MVDEHKSENKLRLDYIDKDPFFETFDVFDELNLKGKTLVQALSIVLLKAENLYSKIETQTNTKQIPAFKYRDGHFENSIQSEDKLMETVNKSISMFEYDHAVVNLMALANFYKKAYFKSQIYEPFIKYVTKLFKKFQEIKELMTKYEEMQFEIDKLLAENQIMSRQTGELKQEKEHAQKNLKIFKEQFKKMYLNERVLKFFVNSLNTKIVKLQDGQNIYQIVATILWDGRQSKKDLSKLFHITEKQLVEMIEPHKELFNVVGEFVDLNFNYENIKKNKITLEIDEFVSELGIKEVPTEETEIEKEKLVEDKTNKAIEEYEKEPEAMKKTNKTAKEMTDLSGNLK